MSDELNPNFDDAFDVDQANISRALSSPLTAALAAATKSLRIKALQSRTFIYHTGHSDGHEYQDNRYNKNNIL